MRILHVAEAFTGGIITYLQGLVNGMGEAQRSYILYARREDTPARPERLFRPGTVLIESAHMTRELSPAADLAALRELRECARALRPDVVHLHSSKAGALGRWALGGVPLFYTPHGYSFLMCGEGRARRRLYLELERLCALRPCTTIACGPGEFAASRRVTRRSVCVNNGIDTRALDALFPNPGPGNGAIYVCTLARATRQKNPGMFNEVARLLPDVRFVWIGDGELRGELTSPNVEVTGWLPRERALELLAGARAFLLPSLWEGLPMALLEAMYLRVPCVASGIAGISDLLRPGETGCIAACARDYADALRALLERGPEQRMLDAARALVAKRYSQREMARRVERIYREAARREEARNRSWRRWS